MTAPSSLLTRRHWLRSATTATAALALTPPLTFGAAPAGAVPAGSVATPTRLNLNENPFGPSPLALEAIQRDLAGLHTYTTAAAAEAVTAQIAALEGVAPEQIVLGEILEPLGLHLSLRAGAGGEFILSTPGYPALADAAARVGGVSVAVPLNAALENDLPALLAAITARTQALFLVNPHNPSGTVNDAAAFTAFVRAAAARTLVIVDEAYLDYTDDYAARTAVSFVREGENVLVFRTFAKVHGLAAVPFGYAVAPRALAAFLRAQGLGFHRDLNRLALTAASASLRDPALIPRVRATIATERARWHAWLDERGLRRTTSLANFVYFDTGRPHAEVAAALRAAGFEVSRLFAPYTTWVRITLGTPEENQRARDAVAAALA